MASIEREVENALLNVVSGIGGVNFYTSERSTARTIPSVTVQAQIGSEELVPFSGVFKTPTTITYVARADTTARADFDAKFYDILEQLYRSPDLASYLTDNSNLTFYVAKVTGDSPSVISQNRTWSRAMTLDITSTAVKASSIPLSGLSLWLKADAGVTLSGVNVTAWEDQSGNGNNASVENSGEEPTLEPSFSNGKSAIQFNGTTQLLSIADSNSLDFLNTSIFIVLKRTGYGTGNEVTFMKNANALAYSAAYWQTAKLAGGNSSFDISNGGGYDRDSGVDIGDGVARVMDFTFDGTHFNIYVNGVQTATYNEPVGNIDITSGSLQIGGYNQSFGNPSGELFNGQIAEIIMYNRAVTATERQQVESYLNTKYAIY
jgi:hypothetical protein